MRAVQQLLSSRAGQNVGPLFKEYHTIVAGIRSATVETREAVLAFEKVKVVQDKDEYGRTPTQMFENEKIAEPNRNMYDRIPTDKQEVPTPSKLYKLLRKCSDQHSKLVKINN